MAFKRVGVGVQTGSKLLVRRNHGGGQDRKNTFSRYVTKVLDNPLPLGVGALVVGILQFRRIQEREKRKESVIGNETGDVNVAAPWQVTCYRSLPLRHVSRLWGAVNELNLPNFLKNWILGAYIRTFECDLTEAEHSDLDSYQNLGQFFRRRLRPGVRPVEEGACLVSPCDGKVLHWGSVGLDGQVEQVKGVSYALQHFLGQKKDPTGISLETVTAGKDLSAPPSLTCLYQCVLYLAPGDYHCFHSPVDWQVTTRRHFPGELLSVSPGIVGRIQGLFNLNERVAYLGRWKHGFFSMTAVGATNVGSIKDGFDPNLVTNTRRWELDTFHQEVWKDGVEVRKGDYFGEFNLGSTIVLIFEAPQNFDFSFTKSGEVVKMGKAIGQQIEEENFTVVEPVLACNPDPVQSVENSDCEK